MKIFTSPAIWKGNGAKHEMYIWCEASQTSCVFSQHPMYAFQSSLSSLLTRFYRPYAYENRRIYFWARVRWETEVSTLDHITELFSVRWCWYRSRVSWRQELEGVSYSIRNRVFSWSSLWSRTNEKLNPSFIWSRIITTLGIFVSLRLMTPRGIWFRIYSRETDCHGKKFSTWIVSKVRVT